MKKLEITVLGVLAMILAGAISLAFTTKRQHDMNTIKIKPVRPSVYFLEGHGGNIGVLTNEEGILIIDDQFAYLHNEISANLKSLSDKEVKYVINTHWHVDHTNGNEKFGEKGCTIIAHSHSAERMKGPQTIQAFNHKQAPYNKQGQAKVTFDDTLVIPFGPEKLVLKYAPHAHTNGDILVYFDKANVVHTGDIFVTYGYPFIDEPNGGSIQGVIKSIRELLSLTDENTLFIPGHGHLSTREDVQQYLNMLETIFGRVQALYNQGASVAQILDSHPCRGYFSEKINEAVFVDIIYKNLQQDE